MSANRDPEAFPMERTPIVIAAADRELLRSILLEPARTIEEEVVSFLHEELDRADALPDDAAGRAVGIGCEVTFIDHQKQQLRVGRLVHPDRVENRRCISVLSPIGSALIGLGPGQILAWRYRGRRCGVTVLRVATKR